MKVTVVGAGAVGATCADNIARKELATELVLLDIKEGIAEGITIDIHVCHTQGCAPLLSKVRNELPCEELGSNFLARDEVPQRARVP